MGRLFKDKRAQSTAEYAVLVALVISVVLSMQTYAKRGLQARLKDAADDYTSSLTSDSNWGTISSTPATLQKQYEDTKLSSQSTQEVLAGTTETSSMTTAGTVTRSSMQKTKQAAGDYQQHNYQ